MLLPYEDKAPVIASDVFIAPTAVIVGDVKIASGSSVWYNAVIRADMAPIIIGAGSNIQDNCTLHVDPGCPLTIGDGVTIGHNAVLHGCTIDNRVLVGMHAVVMNHAHIKTGSVIAASAVVKEQEKMKGNCLIAGIPASIKKQLPEEALASIDLAAIHYQELGATYRRQIKERK
ncbi:MAG: gamma carbonic anhydrase family protein [Desulfobacteraceae bacterium]|nr:gamma carbonic anhydrase family protein [Desulfobacteraceae bacterium]